jgi:hypothetical protein
MSRRIKIHFDANGNGKLECVGLGTFDCQAKPGLSYPKDVTVHDGDKEPVHHSIEFGVDMPFAIRIWPAHFV